MADAQKLLELFINAPGEGVQYWEDLSEVIRNLVHRAVSKREVGDLEDFEEECVPVSYTHLDVYKRQIPYLGDCGKFLMMHHQNL